MPFFLSTVNVFNVITIWKTIIKYILPMMDWDDRTKYEKLVTILFTSKVICIQELNTFFRGGVDKNKIKQTNNNKKQGQG